MLQDRCGAQRGRIIPCTNLYHVTTDYIINSILVIVSTGRSRPSSTLRFAPVAVADCPCPDLHYDLTLRQRLSCGRVHGSEEVYRLVRDWEPGACGVEHLHLFESRPGAIVELRFTSVIEIHVSGLG
jgi:hypothetical protein